MRLSTIRSLYGQPGPWASVYLDATGTRETGTPLEARRELDRRWRAARESLQEAGADEATLRAIDETVRHAPPRVGPAEVAVLATQGTVALSSALPARPLRELATWSPQPHAADLLRAVGGDEVRWVLADVDRTGGTITTDDGHITTVRGKDKLIRRLDDYARDRLWSRPRDQKAAEVTWEQNSAAVARAIAEAAARVGADVVVIAGDVRARQLVIDELPEIVAALAFEVDHERPVRPHPESRLHDRREPHTFDPALVLATQEAANIVASRRRAEMIDRFHAGLSSGESVRGLGPVTRAARELRIDTLLLSTQPSHRHAWVDPLNPSMVGESKRDTGTEAAVSEPADDAVVGAAAVADAEGFVIEADEELVDGLGAILRFSAG